LLSHGASAANHLYPSPQANGSPAGTSAPLRRSDPSSGHTQKRNYQASTPSLEDRIEHPSSTASNTVAAVFTQAAKACIAWSEEFDVLSLTYGAIEENPHNLPSWVPDWTRMSEYMVSKGHLIHKIYVSRPLGAQACQARQM
jgi:hypothetical protein